MKKNLLTYFALASMMASAQNPSSIDFKKAISADAAQTALSALEVKLGQCKTGVYNMRGGKEGGVPASHAYQFQYTLDTDNYCQYFVITHRDFPYANKTITSTYNISGFNGAGHSGYNLVKQNMPALLVSPEINNLPEIKAIFLLYFDLMAQENADLSGPFTYKEDLANSEDPRTYQSVKDIYYAIKADIDQCVACWDCYDNRDDAYKGVITGYLDTMESDGNANWNYGYYSEVSDRFITFKHLANSLQLRLAMHMAKVEPETAKAWAEEAVQRGVIANVKEQQGVFPTTIGFTHPLVDIGTLWNDTRISASFESLLMSLDHPYTKYFFKKNANSIENLSTHAITNANDRIIGIRSGEYVGEGQAAGSNPFINYSTFDKEVIGTAPLYFISYAETCFLQAEGALRGWNMGGVAKDFYEKGIRSAYLEDPSYLEQGWLSAEHNYNEYVEDYLKVNEAKPYTQVDPQGLGEPWPSVTKIGVAWNDADNAETKLEKIITQKYIALFPDSHEAWTELRRTGYPKMFPVLNASDGDGSIKQGEMIRRIPYRYTDPVQLGYWEATGLPALGGPDVQATRLWWDVDTDNINELDLIAGIRLEKEFYNFPIGTSGKFNVYANLLTLQDGDLIWKSSDPSVLYVDTDFGLYLCRKQGTAQVTVALKDDPSLCASATVIVGNVNCSVPTIEYKDETIYMDCTTPNATIKYNIRIENYPLSGTYYAPIAFEPQFIISAVSSSPGFQDSEESTKTICLKDLIGLKGDMNYDSILSIEDVTKLINSIIEK